MSSESLNLPFVEKYRPKVLDDFVGNKLVVKEIERWLRNWNQEKKKVILLVGPAGVGKTSVALYLARKYNYEYIEVNASDKRNKKAVELLVGKASTEGTVLQGGTVRKMIIVDEADGLFGNQDRGGGKALEKAIKGTQIPIIATANDVEAKSLSSAKRHMKIVEFHHLTIDEIIELLKRIVKKENLTIDDEVLLDIAKNSSGDARSALNDLESIALKDSLSVDVKFEFSQRNQEQKLNQALSKIYYAKSLESARKAIEGLDVDYRELLNYVDEHSYKQAKSPKELDNMYSLIAEADFYLSQAYLTQNWIFLKYFFVFISSVGLMKTSPYKQVRYTFPSYWAKIGRLRMKEAKLTSIIKKSKSKFHCSSSQFKQDIYPYLRSIFKNDAKMAAGIATWLNLEEAEIDYLTEKNANQTKLIQEYMDELYVDFVKEVTLSSPSSKVTPLISHFEEEKRDEETEELNVEKSKKKKKEKNTESTAQKSKDSKVKEMQKKQKRNKKQQPSLDEFFN